MRAFTLVLLAPLALAACAQDNSSLQSSAVLPDADQMAGDPPRDAVLNTAYVFAVPSSVAHHPDQAAEAIAQAEYLATDLPTDGRWSDADPIGLAELKGARNEWRAALGIAPNADPQAVINALYAARPALKVGGAQAVSALPQALFPNPSATVAALDNLPRLPQVADATSRLMSESQHGDQDGNF